MTLSLCYIEIAVTCRRYMVSGLRRVSCYKLPSVEWYYEIILYITDSPR